MGRAVAKLVRRRARLTKLAHSESEGITKNANDLRQKLSRFLVPEDRQSHQGDSDDPENDVFSPVFFFLFSHRCSTAYLKSWFKCSSNFPQGHDLTVLIPPP